MLVQTLTFRCHYPGCTAAAETSTRIPVGGVLLHPSLPCGWQAMEGPDMDSHFCPKHTYNPELYDYERR